MSTTEIPLRGKWGRRGLALLVDAAGYEVVKSYSWHGRHDPRDPEDPNLVYARARCGSSHVYAHRLLMNFPTASVDHKNGVKLDNRYCNLRESTANGQYLNRIHRGGSSKYIGVSFHKASGLWLADFNGMVRFQRKFDDEIGAGVARDEAVRRYVNPESLEFARFNFPDPGERGLDGQIQGEY